SVPHSALSTQHSARSSRRRRGVTLTEVLMSLLLMAIGVITLATLFPISILRTMTATRLTRATVLRYNADAKIEVHDLTANYNDPAVVVPPNPDPTPNGEFPEPTQANGVTTAVIDPLGWHTYNNQADMAFRDLFGAESVGNRFRRTGIRRIRGLRYDPANAGLPAGTLPTSTFFTRDAAIDLVALPDGWVNLVTVEGPTFTDPAIPLVLQMRTDLATIAEIFNTTPQPRLRVTIFSIDGRTSEVRGIAAVDTAKQTITLDAVSNFSTPLLAMVEVHEQQFTWMLTCRKTPACGNGDPPVRTDAVVFFRRSFNPEDERFHDVESTLPMAAAGDPAQIGETIVDVTFNNTPALSDTPYYRRGSFVFDPINAYWYQVQDYTNESATGVRLELNEPLRSITPKLVLMPNIVD
ncbi:MAG: type IV pilus modification PilV family protein, partial [Planctomycetaceae bacterium]